VRTTPIVSNKPSLFTFLFALFATPMSQGRILESHPCVVELDSCTSARRERPPF
jgi:hypothetical protein